MSNDQSKLPVVRHITCSEQCQRAVATLQNGIKPETMQELRAQLAQLKAQLEAPELIDFREAVVREAAHQRVRWGSDHDAGKTAADWFWLIGYLAGKALHADKAGDADKLRHHIITTAAACANWHTATLGLTNMRPGIMPPQEGNTNGG